MNEISSRTVEAIAAGAPIGLDLTDERQLEAVQKAANHLLRSTADLRTLTDLEGRLIDDPAPPPLLVHLAVKLARSKLVVDSLEQPTHLSVIFAMYKENRRIRPRTSDNPVGEDFLRRKAQQLDWLSHGNTNLSWRLLAVDDGCPAGSGRIAQQIIDEMGAAEKISVLYLDEAIRRREPVTRPLTDTSGSQKGGSILYGMSHAAQHVSTDHVILFTDADLSTHLGQCGLLLDPILSGTARAAIGSRREPTSVVVKQGRRKTRGKLFIYLWKQLLPVLGNIVDTQCGFKAWRADLASKIVSDSLEKGFAFDIELLIRAELEATGSVLKVPIAWIDSEAASTTTDLEPYLPMLQSTVALYRHYLPSHPRSEEFARLLEALDEAGWNRLIDRMPAAIADGDPNRFSIDSVVTAAELTDRIRV